jgi:ribonuclease Z
MFRAITFLGTSSGVPTKYRNVSATVLALQTGPQWLFDCGEGTQHQFQRCDAVSSGRVERIFITHLHGDHCYGLPGLMCSVAMMWRPKNAPQEGDKPTPDGEADDDEEIMDFQPFSERSEFLELVGPPKLALMLRTVLQCSDAWFPFRYRVTELGGSPGDVSSLHRNEAPPVTVAPLPDGTFDLGALHGIRVRAGPLTHRVASFGYVLEEPDTPGSLDAKAAEALGVPRGPLLAQLKAGKPVTTASGTVVQPAQVIGATVGGRKLVHLGDTCGSDGIASVAANADWLVHEATFDDASAALAVPRGHSTARMAGEFAAKLSAKALFLTHFSARHLPRSKDPVAMEALEAQAASTAPGCMVRAVEDFETIELTRRR